MRRVGIDDDRIGAERAQALDDPPERLVLRRAGARCR
jgi:hypothetical protein